METSTIDIAKAYYTAIATKLTGGLEKYLHDEVRLISPLAELKGKQAVIEATHNFMAAFNTLTIRASFGSQDQAMLAYDADFPAPIGNVRSASLMTFREGLISKIEVFYDSAAVQAYQK